MSGLESTILNTALEIAFGFLFLGALFGFLRMLKGPYLVDRIVALDFLSFVGVATLCLMTLYFTQIKYLDVAIVLALLAFIATIAFARYALRRKQQGAGLEEMDD